MLDPGRLTTKEGVEAVIEELKNLPPDTDVYASPKDLSQSLRHMAADIRKLVAEMRSNLP
jgi:hypothetical protein